MPKNQAQTNLFERPTTRLLGLHKRTESEAKHEGMEAAADKAPDHGYDLEEMRRYARHYIYSNQSRRDIGVDNVVWIDVVRKHFEISGLEGTGNNFLGSLFKKGFIATGEWIKTKTKDCHNRAVMLWTLPEYKI